MSSWTEATLSDICSLITDGTHHSPPNSSAGDYKYVTAKNIRSWGLDITDITYVDAETHASIYARCPVEYGDVLYIKDGVTTGIAAINTLREPFSMLSSVALLKPVRDAVDPRFLKHWLNSPDAFRAVTKEMTGTAIKRLVLKQIRASKIELAPLPEQKRIADKLDSLLARVDACRERLDRLPALFKRFRQSILAAATSGRLTIDWREETVGPWEEVRLSDIGEFGRGKSRHRPRNDPRLYGGPYPFVQTGDVGGSGGIIRSHSQTYSEFGLAQSKLWPAGTLCITIAANIADTAVLAYPSCFPDSVVGFVPDSTKCHVFFVKWAIDVLKEDLERFAPATAQKNINLGVLSEVTFNLPSLAEQHEIVRRVEILFAFADRLEARYAAARKQVGQLTPALLAKAFRGELVPQDPADEPAAELLKRLAATRSAAPKARRGRKSST